MDVIFWEYEPYYESTNDTRITLSPPEGQQEGESNSGGIHMGSILVPPLVGSYGNNSVHSQGEEINNDNKSGGNNSCHGDIHATLHSQNIESLMHEDPGTNSHSLSPNSPSSTLERGDNQLSIQPPPENDLPIARRKSTKSSNIPAHFKDYVGYKHDISNFISYKCCSPSFQSFVASLDFVSIPTNWKLAKEDPKRKEAMLEEMRALEKNRTWELMDLPQGKQPVGCKWVFTIKHTPEGKVERYKVRLVAKGYTQTYGIDYDETFAPVAKMNSVRTLISCAVNLDWKIYQMDVKMLSFMVIFMKKYIYTYHPVLKQVKQMKKYICTYHPVYVEAIPKGLACSL
jgi:hypothetical protein